MRFGWMTRWRGRWWSLSRRSELLHLRHEFPKCQSIAVQVLDDDLADAVGRHARRLQDHGPALLKIGVHPVEIVHVQVDVALERLARPLRQLTAPDLEVDPDARALDDGVDASRFVGRGLEHAVHRIEA